MSKLYLAAAQQAPALAGHIVLEQKGEVIENLMQNTLAQAPDYPYDSARLGCGVTPAERKSRRETATCPLSERHTSLPFRPAP